jgi:peptidoglycan/LPS O-acetylase OafA/YrhL
MSFATVAADPETPADVPLSQHRVPVLDGLRGVAILLVMQYHFWGLLPGIIGRTSTRAIDVQLGRLFAAGWIGVDLFFVLSGFLITGILYDSLGSNSYFTSFYARRFLRVFPVYYVFLAIVLLVIPPVPALSSNLQIESLAKVQVFYWTYTVNIAGSLEALKAGMPLVHSQFWSLAVEEQFYLLWPAVVLFVFRRHRLMSICAAVMVMAFALRCLLVLGDGFRLFTPAAGYILMPCRIDTLAVGGFIALALRGNGMTVARLRRLAPFVGGTGLAVVAALYLSLDRLFPAYPRVVIAGFSALAAFFGAVLVIAVTSPPDRPLHRAFNNPLLRTFGKYSYALYVVHLAVAFQLIRFVGERQWVQPVAGSYLVTNVIFSALATAVSLAIAWVSWHVLENPILGLKRYFPYVTS